MRSSPTSRYIFALIPLAICAAACECGLSQTDKSAQAAQPQKAVILGEIHLPIREISGLAWDPASKRVVAVSDNTFRVATFDPDTMTTSPKATIHDLPAPSAKGSQSQWEGIAVFGDRWFILDERNKVFVYRKSPLELLSSIDLAPLNSKKNSGPEGIVVHAADEFYVAHEKSPRRVISYAPKKPGANHFMKRKEWRLDDRTKRFLHDLSELAVAPDGRLFLLSQQSRMLVECKLVDNKKGKGRVTTIRAWRLPKRIKNPEGLALLGSNKAVIGADRKGSKSNIYLIKL